MATPKLKLYRQKRDFKKTAEPSGARKVAPAKQLRFVIQKHDATRLHYDLRLELGGVFKSWAVTKGPSLSPHDKRLAVEVEDHPLDYGDFEGTIPKGEYGGGTVMIWDRGFWAPEPGIDAEKALRKGELKFVVAGEKLNGGFVLVRLRNDRERNKRNNWLLIKHRDEYATDDGESILDEDRSVASGRSMEQIAAGKGKKPAPFMLSKSTHGPDAVWHSNKESADNPGPRRPANKPAPAKKTKERDTRAEMPDFIQPMLCASIEKAPTTGGWGHEIKFDGYRMQLRVEYGDAHLRTRKGLDWSEKFPFIVRAASALPDCIVDGEVVALDDNGVSSFSGLQVALSEGKTQQLIYFAFDLLFLDGEDLRPLPLRERKAKLDEVLGELDDKARALIRFTDHLIESGQSVYEAACRMKLEGIISKRLDAPYQSTRSGAWAKTKCRPGHEVVIGGWAQENGRLRSLLVGVPKNGDLAYVGRVGTGFPAPVADQLVRELRKRPQEKSPFSGENAPKRERGVLWVKPELVAEIEYGSWTHQGLIRQSAFKGLRLDKAPKDVRVDAPQSIAAAEPDPNMRRADPMPRTKSISSATKDAAYRGVSISKPDKALWPDAHDNEPVTKRDLADYLDRVADWMLPHIKGRPCSIVRAPDGIDGQHFFQRHAGEGASNLFTLARVSGDRKPYLQIDSAEALIAAAQIAALEYHPWNCAPNKYDTPGRLVFDLDPGPDVPFADVIAGAKDLKERLEDLGLETFCKTTGGKGLHVVTPLAPSKGRAITWPEAKAFAQGVCQAAAADSPDRYVINMAKRVRGGRIFLDYLRNDRMSTAVAPLSPRARAGAAVSMPLTWRQVKAGLDPQTYTVRTAPKLLAQSRAWVDYDAAARPLAQPMRKLGVQG